MSKQYFVRYTLSPHPPTPPAYLRYGSGDGAPGVEHAGVVVPFFQDLIQVAAPRSFLVVATHPEDERASVFEVGVEVHAVPDAGGLCLYVGLVVRQVDVVQTPDVDLGVL